MKTLITLFTILIVLLFNPDGAQAQSSVTDSIARSHRAKQIKLSPVEQKRQQQNYYKRTLKVDSLKAEKISRIQEEYKAGMKSVEADPSLSMENRRARIKALMEEKNSKLEELLDAGQQARIIPPGEPRRSKAGTKDSSKPN